ncbi:MAG: DUF1003 domain-containing protein [Gemmatimonadaceae bacterium]
MNNNESGRDGGKTPAEAVASAMAQPSNPERRARRSTRMHSTFQAIKAQHSGGQTRMQIIADWLTNLASSTGFFMFHVAAFSAWILLNSGFGGMPAYDPYPFGLLTMVVSLEAIFLSIFVLMSQNRESKIGELREELNLQVNLRIEEEVTKTLQLIAGLYTRLGHTAGEDPELREMLKPLDPERMEREVTEQIHAAIPRLRFGKQKVRG